MHCNLFKNVSSPFYNLKCVKLPQGHKESSISTTLRKYLLSGSPGATIVKALPQVCTKFVIFVHKLMFFFFLTLRQIHSMQHPVVNSKIISFKLSLPFDDGMQILVN